MQYENDTYDSMWQDKDLVSVEYDPIVKRNLSKIFDKIRTKQHERKRQDEQENFFFTDDSSFQDQSLLPHEQEESKSKDIEMGEKTEDTEWVEIFVNCKDALEIIRSGISELKKLHHQHVKFTVQKDFAAEEERIKQLTSNLQQALANSKKNIGQLDKYGLIGKKKKRKQFQTVISNAKKHLFTTLSELSTELQKEQRSFLDKLTQLKSKRQELQRIHNNQVVEEFSKEELERIEALEQRLYQPNVSQEQVEELIRREREVIQRDRELREILTSIVELHDLFQQISALIIEQGSLLDRIDHNIEITHHHIVEGNQNLRDAEKAQGCGCVMMLIISLSIVIVFLAFIVIIKLRYVSVTIIVITKFPSLSR